MNGELHSGESRRRSSPSSSSSWGIWSPFSLGWVHYYIIMYLRWPADKDLSLFAAPD